MTSGANLAVALRRKGLASAAAEQCRRTLAAAEERFGPQHAVPLAVRECLAEALLDAGSLCEAESTVRQLLDAREKMEVPPAAPPGIGVAPDAADGGVVPTVASKQQQPGASSAAAGEGGAAALHRRRQGVTLSSAMLLLVRVLRRKGDILGAEQVLGDILRDRKAAFGVTHAVTIEALAEARRPAAAPPASLKGPGAGLAIT